MFLAVVALLALYAAMSFSASLHKGPAFDEGEHLLVGYANWLKHDFRMESANGDFTKRWATLPFLITRPYFPDTSTRYWRGADAYDMAFFFFFRNSNEPELLLMQGRAMLLLIGLAAGVLVFACSREIFGNRGGLISLTVFVTSSNMLAFGAHVGTVMPVFLTLLGSTWCIWHLLHRVTWGWLLASVVCLGLLFLAKPSGFAIIPMMAVMVAVKLFLRRPLVWALGRERVIESCAGQFGAVCILVAVHAVVSWSMIWANYDFRYPASSDPANPALVFKAQPVADTVNPLLGALLNFSRGTHFLPQGFIEGVRLLLTTDDLRQTFMDGEWKIGGWWYFFPYALWAKTSPVLLALLIIAVAGWWWAQRKHPQSPPDSREAGMASSSPAWYGAIPYFTLLAVYFSIATLQNINIGHRHLLPAYPAMYVLVGAIALAWPWWNKWMKTLVVLLLLGHLGEAVAQYPDYLAYFSPFVGGPSQGYKRLVDSSLDWGMDLPGLKEWLDHNNPGDREQVYLAYFGTDSPRYHNIRSFRLPGYPDWLQRRAYGLSPGIYAISATLFQSLYTKTFGPWNAEYEKYYQIGLHNMLLFESTANDPEKRAELIRTEPAGFWNSEYDKFEKLRFARLCAWLRHNRPPDATVGYSILIWKLSQAEVREALFGPPPELSTVTPGVIVPAKPSSEDDDD